MNTKLRKDQLDIDDIGGNIDLEWDSILNKPPTFPPSVHNHSSSSVGGSIPISSVTTLQSELDKRKSTGLLSRGYAQNAGSQVFRDIDDKTKPLPWTHGVMSWEYFMDTPSGPMIGGPPNVSELFTMTFAQDMPNDEGFSAVALGISVTDDSNVGDLYIISKKVNGFTSNWKKIGSGSSALDNYVTLDTPQNITGKKTWTNGSLITTIGYQNVEVIQTNTAQTTIYPNSITLKSLLNSSETHIQGHQITFTPSTPTYALTNNKSFSGTGTTQSNLGALYPNIGLGKIVLTDSQGKIPDLLTSKGEIGIINKVPPHTVSMADKGVLVILRHTAVVPLIIPYDSTGILFPVGTMMFYSRITNVPVTVTPALNVTVNYMDGLSLTIRNKGIICLLSLGNNEWSIFGDLEEL